MIAMIKKILTAAALLFALLVFAGPGTAEKMPATPTDLTEGAAEPEIPEIPEVPGEEAEMVTPVPEPICAHENVSQVIYFFDSPSYTSLSAATHKVAGPAVVAQVCMDCGAELSAETVDNIEEIRPHSMKKGVCALCGYRQKTAAVQDKRDAPGERTLVAQPDGTGLLFLTLTEQDLAALENAKVKTLLVRGEHGKAEVAVDVKEIREETKQEAASFSIEMAEQEDGSLFAGLSLSNAPGRKDEIDIEGVTLRFYLGNASALKIVLDPTDGDKLTETDGVWDENGYWIVPYVSEGYYLVVK